MIKKLYFCRNYYLSMQEIELKSVVKVCQMDELTSDEKHIVEMAIDATNRSYAPYSKFHVGAAVKLDNGVELAGCNQENAAYPSGLCAERTALSLRFLPSGDHRE